MGDIASFFDFTESGLSSAMALRGWGFVGLILKASLLKTFFRVFKAYKLMDSAKKTIFFDCESCY